MIFVLMNDCHLVDSTVAGHAGNTSVYVRGMVEINVVRKSVDSHPINGFACPPTLVDRFEFQAIRMNGRQRGCTRCGLGTVAIDTSLRGGNGRVSGFVDRIMTVTTIHLEFAGMERVAKWHRLLRAIAGIERDRTRHTQK